MKKTKLPKRILAVLISVMMIVPLITSTVLSANAQIGEFIDNSGVVTACSTYQSSDGRMWAFIQNNYISFFICIQSPNAGEAGTLCHTVPTLNLKEGMDKFDDFGTQYLRVYKYNDCKTNTWGRDNLAAGL